MASRWDFIYDIKPVPIAAHVIEELSKLLAKDLDRWPPDVHAGATGADEARFRNLFEPGAKRPDDKVFRAAFKLARWELQREYEIIDDFMRNERWRAYTERGDGYDAMILLSRLLTEQMLAIIEATGGRIKRPQLVDCLQRMEKRLLRDPLLVLP
jgi:hypothetical protein